MFNRSLPPGPSSSAGESSAATPPRALGRGRASFVLRLAGVEYSVPPLTARAFVALTRTPVWSIAERLAKLAPPTWPPPVELPREFVELFAHVDHRAATDAVCIVVPEMTPATWLKCGSGLALLELVTFFLRAHDWPRIYRVTAPEIQAAPSVLMRQQIGAMNLDDFADLVEELNAKRSD